MNTNRLLQRAAALVLAASFSGCALLRVPPPPPAIDAPVPVTEALEGTGRVELLWDTYGVPHIFAQDHAALFYGFGWSQMRNHGDLVLRLYGQARGRAAEYWGGGFTDSDVWVRTNGVPERAQAWLAAQPPYMLAYLDAFVAGMNAYADKHADALAPAMRQVLPIRVTDVLAHQQRVLNYTFLASPGIARAARSEIGAGSNGWVVGPARSATRNALLVGNPHLPWGDLFTWFEAHLVAPELDAYGATLVGLPTLGIAFNPHLGWTHTVNTIDGADLYDLQTNGDYYWFDNDWRRFEVEEQVLRVRQQDGSLSDQALRIRRSVHGPVIADRDGRAIALRVAGLETPLLMRQYLDMMRATGIGQFEAALAQLQLPLFTVLYADRQGNILHVFNGTVPLRSGGDWSYWSGVVRGDTSATLWTRYHDYIGLPRVHNPPSGWLHNSNDPPWTATLPPPLDPAFYPAYMAPPPSLSFRAQASARMLEGNARITLEALLEHRNSTRMTTADHFLQDAIAAARLTANEEASAAADVLERWDRNADADSRGAVLFLHYLRALERQTWPMGSMFEIGWTPRAPLATPDGLSDPRLAASVLAQAALAVRTQYGSLDIPWGDVYRLRRDTVDLPASGGPDAAGILRVLEFDRIRGDTTRFTATFGDSYITAVEFGTPVRAQTLLVYGNASQPGSPHRTDQIGLYARKQMKPAWLTRDEIMQNLSAREEF